MLTFKDNGIEFKSFLLAHLFNKLVGFEHGLYVLGPRHLGMQWRRKQSPHSFDGHVLMGSTGRGSH